jgi:RNA polymerase sigma-70 factor (ECF subfamily)
MLLGGYVFMASGEGASTSPTLLHRLRLHPTDETAWRQFVDRYGKQIYAWCRHWNLQDADACDITQSVLLKLARRLQTFEYDSQQSFRAWHQTVTRHALHDFYATREGGLTTEAGADALTALQGLESREDLLARMESVFDLELLEAARLRVRLRVQSQTWQAYQLTAEQDVSADEAARQLGIAITAVYAAKSRVLKMLQEEVASLGESRP